MNKLCETNSDFGDTIFLYPMKIYIRLFIWIMPMEIRVHITRSMRTDLLFCAFSFPYRFISSHITNLRNNFFLSLSPLLSSILFFFFINIIVSIGWFYTCTHMGNSTSFSTHCCVSCHDKKRHSRATRKLEYDDEKAHTHTHTYPQ